MLPSQQNPANKVYFSGLDGLRAIAALAVLFFHVGNHLFKPLYGIEDWRVRILTFNFCGDHGGVRFFFVLSGFLITYLMLAEQAAFANFSIFRFYLRRLLRIWPLYYLSLALGFGLGPWLGNFAMRGVVENADPWFYGTFLANWHNIFWHSPKSPLLGVQWSVAIEEQFYILWPLCFTWLGNGKRFMPFLLTLTLLANGFLAILWKRWSVTTFHSLGALNELTLGALGAYTLYHYGDFFRQFFRRFTTFGVFAAYVAGLYLLWSNLELRDYNVMSLSMVQIWTSMSRLLLGLFFVFVCIHHACHQDILIRCTANPLFRFLGKISYSIYLLHMVPVLTAVYLFNRHHVSFVGALVVATLGAVAISMTSYQLLEKPFLKLKRHVTRVRSGGEL